VAYVIDPSIFKMYPMHVDIETGDLMSRGSTVVDYDNVFGKDKNVSVSFGLDLPKFRRLIMNTMRHFR
jgi:pyrimidine-specific ribonucleoside hydrolase